MYSGHIIIQGCQPRPFEGNKYPELYTFHGLNFVWTRSCNECHSRSFIQLASLTVGSVRSSHFIQIITTKFRIQKCFVMCSEVPSLACSEVLHSLMGGGKLYLCRRMMDDIFNLCPGTEGEWWQRYLSWEWRLGSGEAGCLKAQDIDKFIQWTPLRGPFLCFESLPLAKWPTSLMLPMCEECPAMPVILPLLMLVVYSSVRPTSDPCLFGFFENW